MTTATVTPTSDERLARTSLDAQAAHPPRVRRARRRHRRLAAVRQPGPRRCGCRGSAPRPTSRRRRCTGSARSASALLMIGGEFDLSSGVMVGTTGMFCALFAVHSGFNVIVSLVLSLIIAMAIGFLNGFMVVRSGLPSFIITLGTFFIAARVQPVADPAGHRPDPGHRHRGRAGLRVRPQGVRRQHVPHRTGRVQRGDPVVRRDDDHRCVGACRAARWATGSSPSAATRRRRGWSACRPTPPRSGCS